MEADVTWFDWVRYVIAFVLVVTGPGSVLFWFVIHPFAAFWRRVGPGWAYLAGFSLFAIVTLPLVLLSGWLLSIEFGTRATTVVVGLLVGVLAAILGRGWRRHLSWRMYCGVPELAPHRYPGTLLTDGMYARVRHPRYLEVLLEYLACAFISNFLAAYALTVFMAGAIAILIPLEERELAARFGRAYEQYRARVPAIIPTFRKPGA
jgi:protein-S-isoprenylcysteine O-methyltransferase Ste14